MDSFLVSGVWFATKVLLCALLSFLCVNYFVQWLLDLGLFLFPFELPADLSRIPLPCV